MNLENTKPTTIDPINFEEAFTTTGFRTKPRLLLQIGTKYYFKILSPVYEAPEPIASRGADAAKKPMHLCNVFNYADRVQYQLILNQVLEDALKAGDYVGHSFMIAKTKMVDGKGGKKYAAFDVVEGNIKVSFPVPDIDPVAAAPAADANTGLHIAAEMQTPAQPSAAAETAKTPAPVNGAEKVAETAHKPQPVPAAKPAPVPAAKPAQSAQRSR
jgi:hypothetical protein